MSKFFMLLLSMGMMCAMVFGQSHYQLKGKIVDENNEPLIGASVMLYPIQEGTIADINGEFVIHNILEGKYEIEISFMGYNTLKDTLILNNSRTYHAKLKVNTLSLQEVVVTDHYAEKRKKEEALNIEVVNDDYLKQNLGGSLMNSLERIGGVSLISIGSGQSKPLIRGLGFNRVVVAENGIKHEAQQWGADHGLEIDQYAVDNVEIIKGPVSLMYGSDAIGGVINMKNRSLPAPNTIGGTVDLSGKSNNELLGGSVSLYGRKKWFYADFRTTMLRYGDYKVPTDSIDIYSYKAALHHHQLRNTAGKEQNFHITLGVIQKQFQSKFYLSNVYTKSGFFANAHGLEPRNVNEALYDKSSRDILHPYQSVNHFKLTNSSQYQGEGWKLETNLGYQHNYRQERSQYVQHGHMPATFPDTLSFDSDLEREFKKNVYAANAKLSIHSSDTWHFNLGVNSSYQENRIDGRGFIIPKYNQFDIGGFALAKYIFSDISFIQGGIRYDNGQIKTSEYLDWFPSMLVEDIDTSYQYLQRAANINKSFSNVSWSLGYNYNPGKWMYKMNIGKSFRMPIAKELAANGVNYHQFSYEVGNANLAPEVAYQLDAGIEYASSKFAIGASPFLSYFSNYIYLNPSSDHDRLYGNGNQKFYYTESEVFRYGSEIHAHYELSHAIQLGVIGEYVYSEQLSGEKKGFTLPFSPPASAIFNIKYQKPRICCIQNAYLSLDYRITAAQHNIVPPEKSTDGFQVVNVGLGGDLKAGNQKIDISVQVQNLFNTKYFNHTSYYRIINIPEAGRNIIVNLSIPFSGSIN